MPGTTGRGIVFPVLGDKMGPLASWFAQQASSVNDALDAIYAKFDAPELPAPITSAGPEVQEITSNAWADVPNIPSITLDLPRAAWVTIEFSAWLYVNGGEIRAGARVTGATTLSETQAEVGGSNSIWGQVLFTNSTTGTRQSASVRTVRLNAGENVISARAYKSPSTGLRQVKHGMLQVAPLRWA